MALAEDSHEHYRLDVDLEEPVSRAALLTAASRGWPAERVALDTEQTVEQVLMRASEEGVELARLWMRDHPHRDRVWRAMVRWVAGGTTIRDAARAEQINEVGLTRQLARLGYSNRRARGTEKTRAALRAHWKRYHMRHLKRLKRWLAERREQGLPSPLASEAARYLGISESTVARLARDNDVELGERAARWMRVLEPISAATRLPAHERPTLRAIATEYGVELADCQYALRQLDVEWQESLESRVARVRAYQEAHPGAAKQEIACATRISPNALMRYVEAGLIAHTWRRNKSRRCGPHSGALEER